METEKAKVNHNGMTATAWRPFAKKDSSLRGHFQLKLSSGMVISGCSLHEKGKARWIACPAQSYKRTDGTIAYSRIVSFANDQIEKKFRDQALRALDTLLAKQQKPETGEEPGS